ncbi:foldase protein PrsA [Anaplasma platys]|uniref:Parvulin-like PPIase n=1 Tax=Anaplasma platys TaxID=949 RepID=A0A858PY92_9RICK|nr:SurA N-terminal domain-containing protein [Anaplasma platys]QJC27555.1 foldase protein PrsA [Anaplasma platys]
MGYRSFGASPVEKDLQIFFHCYISSGSRVVGRFVMRSRKIYVGLVLGTVLGALVFVTFGSVFIDGKRGGGVRNDCIAELGNRCISLKEYRVTYQNELANMESVLKSKLSDEQILQYGVKEMILKSMLSDVIMEKMTSDLGLQVSAASVRDLIRSMRAFQDSNGEFDKEKYQTLLANSGMDEATYASRIQNALPHTVLLECLFPRHGNSGYPYYGDVAKDVLEGLTQYRIVDAVTISSQAVEAEIEKEVPESILNEMYINAPKESLLFPEYRTADYLVVTEEDALPEVTASEEEVNIEIKNSQLHDQRDVLNLVFSDQEEAYEAYAAYGEGKTFEEIAIEMGNSIEDITVNDISREVLPAEVRGVVFALEEGEVSGVFKSLVGWHIMKVLRKHEITPENLVKLKEKVSLNIRRQKARELVSSTIKKANNSIGSGATLSEVQKMFSNSKTGVLKEFDMGGKNPQGELVQFLPMLAVEAASTLAFSSPTGKPSHFVNFGETYLAVSVTDVVPPRMRTFEESKEILAQQYKDGQIMEKMRELASSIAEKLKNDDLVATAGVSVERDYVVRSDESSGILPEELIDAIFVMNTGDVSKAVEHRGRVYLAVLRGIKGDEKVDDKMLMNFSAHVAGEEIAALREQLLSYLMDKYSVKVNSELLSQV